MHWWDFEAPEAACNKCSSAEFLLYCSVSPGDDGVNWRNQFCNLAPDSQRCRKLPKLFDSALGLVIISTILSGLLIILTIISLIRSKLIPKVVTKAVSGCLGFLLLLMILSSVLLIAVGIPEVNKEDNPRCDETLQGCTFIGYNITMWGPAVGWILAVIAAGLSIIFAVVCFITDYD